MLENYLIIHRSILPEYYEKVLEVRRLMESGKVKEVSQAVKQVGISRSTYYKYKDYVFNLNEDTECRKAVLSFSLLHKAGILGAVLGTYGAGQNYGCYPVLSLDNVVSGITHSISGFASLYIAFSGMTSMKKKNIPITLGILTGFCVAAYIVNHIIDYNFMFMMRGDGTPYDIFYNLVNGHKVIYPILVVVMFFAYILSFYGIYFLISKIKGRKR